VLSAGVMPAHLNGFVTLAILRNAFGAECWSRAYTFKWFGDSCNIKRCFWC